MGRPQEESSSPYPPESYQQPPDSQFMPESYQQPPDTQFTPEGAPPNDNPSSYPSASYPPGNDGAAPQQQFQPPPPQQPPSTNPSPYPAQNPPSNNAAYPPPQQQRQQQQQQQQYYQPPPPPQRPAPNPPQYPPSNAAYPPQSAPYPPNNPNRAGYGPQPVSYPPPPNPSAAVPQQYPPQPASAYKPAQQNGGSAPGFPVQSPYQQAAYGLNVGTMPWTTGIFDCMEDPTNALITACFPCFTFGQIAEIVDSGNTTCGTSGILYGVIALFIGVPCLISCSYRTKLRSKYNLVETPAPDWITHCFCEWCALCQEYRELRARGIDPALGWHGNMAKNQQQAQVGMVPPMQQTMMG